jgi:3-phenylpropionate/cinnamic acid dioxygenase small subunit
MTPDDRQEILDLIHRYSYCYDEHDLESFAALFTDDAVLSLPTGDIVSRAEIHRTFAARRRMLADQGIQPRHHQTNVLLEAVADDEVRGRAMLLLTWQHRGEPGPRLQGSGIYEDRFRRTERGWRLARRRIRVDLPLSELPSPAAEEPR